MCAQPPTLSICQLMQALVDPETNTTSEGVVLQQFEEHGGVLFKVYVLGGLCEVMLRPSLQLPEESREKLHSCRSGWIVLPRFSTTPIVDQEPATYVPEPSSYGAESSRVGLERDNSGTRGSSPGCSGVFLSVGHGCAWRHTVNFLKSGSPLPLATPSTHTCSVSPQLLCNPQALHCRVVFGHCWHSMCMSKNKQTQNPTTRIPVSSYSRGRIACRYAL